VSAKPLFKSGKISGREGWLAPARGAFYSTSTQL
jgi:hypothetical protein